MQYREDMIKSLLIRYYKAFKPLHYGNEVGRYSKKIRMKHANNQSVGGMRIIILLFINKERVCKM
jgi:hypothetical protein